MKKKIFYTFIGLLIVLILLYLIRYKTTTNYKNRIPENATAIVRIDIRQLEHHFLVDAIKNPMTYFRSSKKSKTDSLKIPKKKNISILKALKIPKNILFYSTGRTSDKSWKSDTIKIKDLSVLKTILEHYKFKSLQRKDILVYYKKAIRITIKKEELIILINSKKTTPNFDLLFNNIKFLDEKSALYNNLIKNKNDIVYITDKENVSLQFNHGEIIGSGFANFDLFTNSKQEIFANNIIGMFSVSINKENYFFKKYYNEINKEKFRNNFKLNIDSLSSKWNGNLQFNLFDFKVKSDTIKTYEYDDDFNKIEKVAIQKNSFPEFKISINDSNKDLNNYLVHQKAIQLVENDSIFTTFPLMKILTNYNNGKLNFKSTINKNEIKKRIENRLNLQIDFESYRKKTEKTHFSYFNKIKSLKNCDIRISNNHQVYIKIKMTDKNRNSLTQLFNFN